MTEVLTVRAVIALYLRHSAAQGVHGPEARDDRVRTLGWFADACGDLTVEACKPYHLTDFIESHAQWKSVATRRSKANAVRACFAWAAKQERIGRNPFQSVQYAEAERRPELPDDVLEKVATLANKPFEKVLRFLRLTGARLNELCLAVWSDVDLERGLWLIPRHKSRTFTQRPKLVALVPEAVALLRTLDRTEGAIFRNNRGQPWNRRTLGQQFRRLKRRFGIAEKASLHGIRHRMATAAIVAGAPLKLVAEQLGHATTTITERYYYHADVRHIDAVREAAQMGLPKKG